MASCLACSRAALTPSTASCHHAEGAPQVNMAGGWWLGAEEKGGSSAEGKAGAQPNRPDVPETASKQGYARLSISRETTDSRGTALLWLQRRAHPSPLLYPNIGETFPTQASR